MIRYVIITVFIFHFGNANLHANPNIYINFDTEGNIRFSRIKNSDSYKVYIRKTKKHSKDTHRYDDVIYEAAMIHGLSFSLIKAMIHVESYFDPKAISKNGAIGLMQIMPENFEALKINDPFDPWENVMGGTFYMKSMIERFNGDLNLALAAYNAGPGVVERYNCIPPYSETKKYIQRVRSIKKSYQKELLGISQHRGKRP